MSSFLSLEARLRSFNLDQLVREHTRGKGYTPAPPPPAQWTLCGTCNCPVGSKERVVIAAGRVFHGGCR